tara:strand:+ start:3745 stop:3993 length:249 start_codon:yes stop_codon:yes gene_type:complete
MGYYKKQQIEALDLGYTKDQIEENIEYFIEMDMQELEDTAWDIKKEGHLNPNNIIFQDKKYVKTYETMKEVDDKIKEKRNEN